MHSFTHHRLRNAYLSRSTAIMSSEGRHYNDTDTDSDIEADMNAVNLVNVGTTTVVSVEINHFDDNSEPVDDDDAFNTSNYQIVNGSANASVQNNQNANRTDANAANGREFANNAANEMPTASGSMSLYGARADNWIGASGTSAAANYQNRNAGPRNFVAVDVDQSNRNKIDANNRAAFTAAMTGNGHAPLSFLNLIESVDHAHVNAQCTRTAAASNRNDESNANANVD